MSEYKSYSIVLGVTGHRDLLTSQHKSIITQFDKLLKKLKADYPNLSVRVITGLAEGADTLIANHVLELMKSNHRIELMTALPMPIDEYRNDFSGEVLQTFNHTINTLNKLNQTIIELPMESSRDNCYQNLGIYLHNKSDLLVSVWNGVASDAVGGTAYVTGHFITPLKYWDEEYIKNNAGSQINPSIYDAQNKAVYHIKVNRQSDNQPDDLPVTAEYISSLDGMTEIRAETLPQKLKNSLEQMNGLSELLDTLKQQKVSTYPLMETLPEGDRDLMRIADTFRWTDAAANHVQKKVISIYFQAALLTLAIGWCFVIFKEIANSVLIVGYILMIVGAIFWYRQASPDQIKARYAFYRALAETLRIEYFLRASALIPANGSGALIDAVESQGNIEEQAIKSIVRQQSALGYKSQRQLLSVEQVTQHWLEDQKSYYVKTLQRIKSKSKRLKRIATYLVYFPIAVLLFVFAAPLLGLFDGVFLAGLDLLSFIKLVSQMLPVVGASVSLYAANQSFSELAAQYQSTLHYLDKILSLLSKSNSQAMQKRILRRAAEHLSREHWSWMILTKQKVVKPKY